MIYNESVTTHRSVIIQSTGWPSVVSIMSHWFGKQRYCCLRLTCVNVLFSGNEICILGMSRVLDMKLQLCV